MTAAARLRRARAPWCLALLLPFAAAAAESEVQWMALMLEGQKTGYLRSERTVHPDRVEHEEQVHLEIQRAGVAVAMTTVDHSVESLDGRPLAFSSRQEISGSTMEIRGEVAADGTVAVTTVSAGSERHQSFPWPEGALLPEGLRLLTLEQGLEAGTRFEARAFVASSLRAADVEVEIFGREPVDLFGIEKELRRTRQTMDLGQTRSTVTAWVDERLVPARMQFSIMGLKLETIACPESCARAISEPAEFFSQAFATSPRSLGQGLRARTLRYRIQPEPDAQVFFPQSSEQRVQLEEDGALTVTVSAVAALAPPPGGVDAATDWLASTRWLQADAPEIEALLAAAGGPGEDPRAVMQRLEAFVRDHVSDKSLSVGYATALETARSGSGDCTEHALLLAALGRAAGIPTRIATGVAYVDGWLGAKDVFVPHAWAQARIDGRWVSFDAALGDFGSGHIALSYGDGDPWDFYDSVNTLGNFEVVAVETATP